MTMQDLPPAVVSVIENSIVSEFATVSAAGVPIDTPTYCFATDDLSAIGVATGLSYPAKAERARRNPKTGLLLEGMPGQPVVSIRGMAAVRDADLGGNAIRYLSETGFEGVSAAAGNLAWAEAKKAVWYWTRIIIDVFPERIMWWDSAEAMDTPPHIWNAPRQNWEASDPAPAGKVSAAPQWPQRPWQEIAEGAVGRGAPAHLTLLDPDGWPLPIRATACKLLGDTFRLSIPKAAPWRRSGKATLTFQGVETFVGDVTDEDGVMVLNIERALPQNPLVLDPAQVLQPSEAVRQQLMGRLQEETSRRGQPIPVLGDQPPAYTRLAQSRVARLRELKLD
jgi:hypothetical protein